MKKLLALIGVAVAAVIIWGVLRRSSPPTVKFTRVERTTLISTLSTNGKAEPLEWQQIHTEAGGMLHRLLVSEGQTVVKGAVIAEIADPSLTAEADAAAARLEEASAALTSLQEGGKSAELAELNAGIARATLDLDQARQELAPLERLLEKQAVTKVDTDQARAKVRQAETDLSNLRRRRSSLVGKSDLAAAQARVNEASAAVRLARDRASVGLVRSPLSGVIYDLSVRPGAFLARGDAIANVGRMDKLRVRVYVDEPELGRVKVGMPVAITWDALSGKRWNGTVERMPSTIETMGSRQVGQVQCVIENPNGELIPGTNVNAEIRTAVVENALVIPKEALRHDARGDYVYALKGGALERHAAATGHSNITRIELVSGAGAGDALALPFDLDLTSGSRVSPQF